MSNKICTFFGHRLVPENIDEQLTAHIRYAIETLGVTDFYLGSQGDFDRLTKGALLRCKKEFPQIRLLFMLAYFPDEKTLIDPAYDDSIYLEGLETVPRRFAISKRNRLMVTASDVVICYIRRKSGGAYVAAKQAEHNKKTLLRC